FETSFNAPIPLGGIVARKDQPQDEIKMMDALIQGSVQYAFKNSYEILPQFVKYHAQEMSEQVMRQHINLYVNDFSIQMGEVGKNAIAKLEQVYNQIVR
ncbi:MAG: MqnA/MqnD/SBP family protein, partial [Sediminibacterium sp.]